MGAPIIKEVDRHKASVMFDDGSSLPVNMWHSLNGRRCAPAQAVYCVAGPDEHDNWYNVDLSLFDLSPGR